MKPIPKLPQPFDILLPYQRRIFVSQNPKLICCCSRQIGKSMVAMAKAVHWALLHPGSLTLCISTGERAAKELLLKGRSWAEACLACGTKETLPYLQYSASSTEIKFANGSRIMVLPSGNPDALRGYTGNLILDEMAILDNDKEVWRAIAPSLTNRLANPNKWIAVFSTPTGLNTQFAKLWQSDESLGWEKHKLTIEDAVKEGLPADIEELKNIINDPLIWGVEYECKFASTSDMAFPVEWLTGIGENYVYNPSLPCWMGVDVARTSDYTVIAIVQQDLGGCFHLIELVNLKNCPFNEQLQTLRSVWSKYGMPGGAIDSTGIGKMFAEEAARTISSRLTPFVFTASSKTEIFERLRKAVQSQGFKVPEDQVEVVTNDLLQLRRLVDTSIHYTAPHTKSGHADISTAIALALQASHALSFTNALPIPSNVESRMSYSAGFGFGRRLQ